jgi:hypothetical protein
VAAGKTSMLKNKHLKDWSCIVSKQMPHLSIPQAIGLATWSLRVVMTKSSSLTQVSHLIAQLNGEKPNTVRQRLKKRPQQPAGYSDSENRRLGFEAQWLDDFHHALLRVADERAVTRYEDFGEIEQLAKALKEGFVHSGDYVVFVKRNSDGRRQAWQEITLLLLPQP